MHRLGSFYLKDFYKNLKEEMFFQPKRRNSILLECMFTMRPTYSTIKRVLCRIYTTFLNEKSNLIKFVREPVILNTVQELMQTNLVSEVRLRLTHQVNHQDYRKNNHLQVNQCKVQIELIVCLKTSLEVNILVQLVRQ